MEYMRECSSPELLSVISIVKNIISLLQIIVPIILIIFAGIGLFKLVKNPEEKKGIKNVINKFIAALVVFFIPIIVNAFMYSLGSKYDLTVCWSFADEFKIFNSTTYISIDNDQSPIKIFTDSEEYEEGVTSSSACGEKIAKLAVDLSGTASPESFIKAPSGSNYCAFNKSSDSRLAKYNQVHDSRVSCNHAYASCTQAAATIIDAAADPEINWMGPRAQLYYLEHSSKWEEVIRPTGASWTDVLQPGDVGEAIWGANSSGHSWIYVGNELAKEKYPNTDGFIYDGGYTSCKNPYIYANKDLINSNDSAIRYFRFIGDCSEAETKNVKDGYGGPTAYKC